MRVQRLACYFLLFGLHYGMNLVQTSVSSKGQMVLPAKLRARYNIGQGTRITLLCDDAGFYVRKATDDRCSELDQVVGVLSRLAAKKPPRPASPPTSSPTSPPASPLSEQERIGHMLLADDQRVKQDAHTASAAPVAVRKRMKPLKLAP